MACFQCYKEYDATGSDATVPAVFCSLTCETDWTLLMLRITPTSEIMEVCAEVIRQASEEKAAVACA